MVHFVELDNTSQAWELIQETMRKSIPSCSLVALHRYVGRWRCYEACLVLMESLYWVGVHVDISSFD